MFFFFNDTATTEIYTLSLHDALPILNGVDHQVQDRLLDQPLVQRRDQRAGRAAQPQPDAVHLRLDRKSTRLNSSHANISYAVFCLKKKKKKFGDSITTYQRPL